MSSLQRRHHVRFRSLPVTPVLISLVLTSTWTLEVRRDERATTCPDQARLRRAIAERLGKDPFLDVAPAPNPGEPDDDLANPFDATKKPAPAQKNEHHLLSVNFSADSSRHLAVVSLIDLAGKETGRRELTSTSSDCTELSGAVVLASAIVIDPMVLTRPAPMPIDAGVKDDWAGPPLSRPPDAPRPPPVKATPQPVPVELPPLPRPPVAAMQPLPPVKKKEELPPLNAISAGLGGGVSIGQVPTVAALGELHVSWGTRYSLLTARFGLTTPGALNVGSGGVRAMLLDGGVQGCAKWLVFGLCLTANVGSLQAWAVDLPNPRPQGALFFGLGGGGVLDVPIGSLMRLRLSANALVQPRVTLAIGGVPVWESSQFAFTALASIHFKLWGDVVP